MAWELSASPTCLPNGPASTRCSRFRPNSCPFEPSLCRLRSPLPGNGISWPEKNAPGRRPNHGSAVPETKRSHKNPANSGPFSSTTGNLRNRRNAWWAREDSNLQPDRYERSALTIELRARCVRTQAAPLAPHTMPRCGRQSRPARTADAQENGAAESPRKPAFERIELHFEKPLGVAAQDLGLVLIAQRHALHPLHRRLVGDERPINREQDAVDANLHDAAQQRRIGEVAAGRDVEVAAEGLAEAYRRRARAGERVIDAPHQERQRLPEMAEDDLEPGIGLEHPAEHKPDRLRRRFDRVAPGGAHDHRKILGVILVVSIHHRWQRNRWMQVDRNVERLRALEDRPEPLVVEKDPI